VSFNGNQPWSLLHEKDGEEKIHKNEGKGENLRKHQHPTLPLGIFRPRHPIAQNLTRGTAENVWIKNTLPGDVFFATAKKRFHNMDVRVHNIDVSIKTMMLPCLNPQDLGRFCNFMDGINSI